MQRDHIITSAGDASHYNTNIARITLRNCSISVLFQGLSKGGVRHRSNDSIHLLPILEDHDCGDAPDTIFSSYSRAFVCIELELQHCQVFVKVAKIVFSACLGVWMTSCKQ